MSIFKIKRKNPEFGKWWDRWASRLQRVRATDRGAEVHPTSVRSTDLSPRSDQMSDLPYAVQILRRFPYKYEL
jgi:hypothetical protein